MADNKITSKPAKVNFLSAPTRSNLKFSVSWKNPPANVSSSGKARATSTGISWYMQCYPDKYTRTYKYQTNSGSTTSDTLDLDQMLSGLPGHERDFFHPVGKVFIKSVSVNVHPYNSVGQAPAAKTTITLQKPSAPTIGDMQFDEEAGEVTFEIERPESTELQEAYDVQWWAAVYDVTDESASTKAVKSYTGTSTEESFTTEAIDITGYAALAWNKSKKIVVSAKTRGWAGDSALTTRTFYVARPPVPTITGTEIPSTYTNDRVVARVRTNATTTHPVTGCRLQVLKDVDYDCLGPIMMDLDGNTGIADATTPMPDVLPSGEEWVDIDQQDDGQVYALACNVADVVPAIDKHTWIRVKTWNIAEVEGLTHVSQPVRLKKLETKSPNPEDDQVFLAPLMRDTTGTSVVAGLYWGQNAQGGDDSDGTEVTWSTDENAWLSTVQPDSYQTTRDDGPAIYGEKVYPSHTTLYIRGLEPGERYYVRAHRYKDAEEGTVYGKWSTTRSIVVGNPPSACTLSAPAYLVSGKNLYATWSVTSQEEVADKIKWVLYKNPIIEDGAITSGTVLKTGTGGGGTTVSWEKLALPKRYAGDIQFFDLALACSFGGGTVVSQSVRVWVVEKPKCEVVAGIVTSQPASFDVLCNDKGLDLAVTVRSLGSAGTMPDERREQETGDCVWTSLIEEPAWDENTDSATKDAYPFRVTVTMPNVDLRDNARYRAYASACSGYIDDGPRGSTARSDIFSVAWAHQAPTPGTPVITPQDITDEDGNRTRRCRVRLTAATGAASTDYYDVYRMTQDGPQLIATRKAAGDTVTDNYAPFGTGELAYRVVSVTDDGDMRWDDFEYELAGGDMRIDFDGTYVELPYNVAWSDSYAKDFETRAKLDGSLDGYWNRAITRSASLSTDLIRIRDFETARRLRQLARFPGVCFVRLPNGCAFEADVQVNDMSEDRMGNYALACSLSATEVSPTGTYVNGDYPLKSS